MNLQLIDTGYQPRNLQRYLHNKMFRAMVVVLVIHRRFGKTVMVINHMITKAMMCPDKNPQYAYIAPTQKQAKSIAWDYFKEYTKKFPDRKVHVQELRITIQRPNLGDEVRFVILGAENFDSIRGMYFQGAVLDEYGDMNPKTYTEVLSPALADNDGWVIFIGTPKGRNAFYEQYTNCTKYMKEGDPDYFTALLKISETNHTESPPIINPKVLERNRKQMSPAEYAQEFECDFYSAVRGAYFSNLVFKAQKEGRIREIPYDPALPVDTFWDLGVNDMTTIWFRQQVGTREYRYIDYYQNSDVGMEHYLGVLREKGYSYGMHHLPHDAAVREWSTGVTRIDSFKSHGISNVKACPKFAKSEQVESARKMIPKAFFDSIKCNDGIESLRMYRREFDDKTQTFKKTAVHDKFSHGADSFMLSSMEIYGGERMKELKKRPMSRRIDYDDF